MQKQKEKSLEEKLEELKSPPFSLNAQHTLSTKKILKNFKGTLCAKAYAKP